MVASILAWFVCSAESAKSRSGPYTYPWRRGWCDPISDGLIILATVDVDQSFCSDRVTPAQRCLQVQIRGALNY